jgi:hypothetical protein
MSNGVNSLYKLSTGEVYLLLFGEYWYIADPATLSGVFGGNPVISPLTTAPTNLGPVIENGSFLWLPPGQNNLYFVCAGSGKQQSTYYWITTQNVLAKYQFNGPVQSCSNQSINNLLMVLLEKGQSIT